MKKCLIILIFFSFTVYAQNRNSVWIFGDSAGIDFSNLVNPITSGMDGRGSCASISDTIGNLIFYSYTRADLGDWAAFVHNKQKIKIQNGDSITGIGMYQELIIIPRDSNRYFLFSYGSDTPNNDGLYYSIVDMNLNGGLGAVTKKDVQINPNRIGDCITAVKHGNGRDWWFIGKLSDGTLTSNFNRFFVYLITPDSIYQPVIEDFNDTKDVDFQKIVWHPSSNKFMLINLRGYMSEFSFDRCTGQISLLRNILPEFFPTQNTHPFYWEGAYSPNGNMFYATTTQYFTLATSGYLIQYDLQSTNIIADADTLDIFQTPIGTGALRLGPDNKIYFSRAYEWGFPGYPYPDSVYNIYNMNLSVINLPDSLGSACNYQPFSFYLGGKRTYYGLPNNPNYDLGPLVGSICDALTVGTSNYEQGILNVELTVNYNPWLQTAFINAKNLKGRRAEMFLYDITGKIIIQTSKNVNNSNFSYDLNMQQYAKGLYIIKLMTEKETLVKKFVKQ